MSRRSTVAAPSVETVLCNAANAFETTLAMLRGLGYSLAAAEYYAGLSRSAVIRGFAMPTLPHQRNSDPRAIIALGCNENIGDPGPFFIDLLYRKRDYDMPYEPPHGRFEKAMRANQSINVTA